MPRSRNPNHNEIVKLAQQGVRARAISDRLGICIAEVSRVMYYWRARGVIPPYEPVPVTRPDQLANLFRRWGLAGIGKVGPPILDLPEEVREWLFDKCTPNKTMAEVLVEIAVATYDAEKDNSGT